MVQSANQQIYFTLAENANTRGINVKFADTLVRDECGSTLAPPWHQSRELCTQRSLFDNLLSYLRKRHYLKV